MLEDVHKGLHTIDALKVAIDRCLLSHFFSHAKVFTWIIRCLRNDVRQIHTDTAHVDHVNEGLANARPNNSMSYVYVVITNSGERYVRT